MEYDVVWGDGSLGLTLRPDLGEDMPPVVGRITRKDSAAALANVCVGHLLISINGNDTARRGYDNTVDLLQTVERPATLRFRAPRTSTSSHRATDNLGEHRKKREEYTIVWRTGPLGLILRPDDTDCHVPCIRKLTGKGEGVGIEKARVGDLLTSVNGQESKSIGFRSTISLLKTIRKPAVLKFKRMGRRVSKNRSSVMTSASAPVMPSSSSSRRQRKAPPSPEPPSSNTNEFGVYDIVWRGGELGLKLKPNSSDIPVVSRLTGKGTASGLHNATVGDELLSVNGDHVEGQSYKSTLRQLKYSPKPAILRFKPSPNRRESMMSGLSSLSARSAPNTRRHGDSVGTGSKVSVPMQSPIEEVSEEESIVEEKALKKKKASRRSPSPSRKKRPPKISLEVAIHLVCESKNLDPETDSFEGVKFTEIEGNSRIAQKLRLKARKYVVAEAEARRRESSTAALSRTEREAEILAEALQRVKDQAKEYEEIISAKQEREKILSSALKSRPQKVVGMHNNLIAELSNVIVDYKKESYSDEEERFDAVRNDLQTVIEGVKTCADCGITADKVKLELDDDGEWYCLNCWEAFIQNAQESDAKLEAAAKLKELQQIKRDSSEYSRPRTSSKDPSEIKQRTVDGQKELVVALQREEEKARGVGKTTLADALAGETARLSRRLSKDSGSFSTGTGSHSRSSHTGSSKSSQDDNEPQLRFKKGEHDGSFQSEEEYFREEARLRDLERVGALQRKRAHDAKLLGQVIKEEESEILDDGREVEPSGLMDRLTIQGPPVAEPDKIRQLAEKQDEERWNALKRMRSARQKGQTSATAPLPPPAPVVESSQVLESDGTNRSESQDEAEAEAEAVRVAESKNFALAKQLEEAHNVVERARESITRLSFNEGDGDKPLSPVGLSNDQVHLFKKLTLEAGERASFVDQFHPSDSESSSGSSSGDYSSSEDESESDSDSQEERGPSTQQQKTGVWI